MSLAVIRHLQNGARRQRMMHEILYHLPPKPDPASKAGFGVGAGCQEISPGRGEQQRIGERMIGLYS